MPELLNHLLAAHPPLLSPLFVIGAIVIVLGLACGALIIARYLPARQLRVGPKPWDLRDLGWVAGTIGGIVYGMGALYSLIAVGRGQPVEEIAPVILPIEFLVRLALLGGLFGWFAYRHIRIAPAFGFDALPVRLAVGWGLGFALAILPPVGVLLFLINALGRLFGIDVSDQAIVALFLETKSPSLLALLVVFAVVLAPVFEELLFRGYAYPALKTRFGFPRACLLVSSAFALTHFHGPSFLPLGVLAVGLTLAYELTGSLLTSIVMHAVFNGIMLLQLFATPR
jgi:membrane protease YdiL (CAAX protease family)